LRLSGWNGFRITNLYTPSGCQLVCAKRIPGGVQFPLAFMGYKYTAIVFTALALVEFVMDKLPKTPSRKTPQQFTARILSGALTGATIGAAGGSLLLGILLGVIGAVLGTFGGAAMRAKLAAAFGRDLPAALLEDVMAIGLAIIFLLGVR
jgi:uncharacterized membrane protein